MSLMISIRQHHSLTRGRTSASRSTSGPRTQRVSAVEMVTLVVIAALLVVGVLATRPQPVATASTGMIRVEAGDTLWSIAKSHPVPGLSTAQAVELIAANNHVPNGPLSVGSSLEVPAGEVRGAEFASR